MEFRLLPMALSSAAAMALLWSPQTFGTQVSAPIPSLPLLGNLDLTTPQQHALQALRNNMNARIKEMLTPEQSRRFATSLLQTRDFRAAIAAMRLSRQQIEYLIDIFQSSQTQMLAILTVTQRTSMEERINRLCSQFCQGNAKSGLNFTHATIDQPLAHFTPVMEKV